MDLVPLLLFFIIISVARQSIWYWGYTGLLYQPRMIDDGDCGAGGGMKIGRGILSTVRKPVPAPLCPPQIPHAQNRARTRVAVVGSRWLTSWAMARIFVPQGVYILTQIPFFQRGKYNWVSYSEFYYLNWIYLVFYFRSGSQLVLVWTSTVLVESKDSSSLNVYINCSYNAIMRIAGIRV
jgi:hypothetical protein